VLPSEKQFVYGKNALQITIFWHFIILPPYQLPKIHDGWVLREGYDGYESGEKNFKLSSLLIV
jgi:hypothetical protein